MKKIVPTTIILISLMAIGATCSDGDKLKGCMNSCVKQFSICTNTCAGTYSSGNAAYAPCVAECGDKRNDCQLECEFQ